MANQQLSASNMLAALLIPNVSTRLFVEQCYNREDAIGLCIDVKRGQSQMLEAEVTAEAKC